MIDNIRMQILDFEDLMEHMRQSGGMMIEGDKEKLQLMQIGYYHGYKGYRFDQNAANRFGFSMFKELMAVYDFDAKLREILYGPLMRIEANTKSFLGQQLAKAAKSPFFEDIFCNVLNHHLDVKSESERRRRRARELEFQAMIYGYLSERFESNTIIHHYLYVKNEPLPIWGLIEGLSLGEVSRMTEHINIVTSREISLALGIKPEIDPKGSLFYSFLQTIHPLRNAVAHNMPVFDVRFRPNQVNSLIASYLSFAENVNMPKYCNFIIDYFVIVAAMLRLFKFDGKLISDFIDNFSSACEELREKIPYSEYSKIVPTYTKSTIQSLRANR